MAAEARIAAARDPAFAGRVTFIALSVAQNVASEDPGTAEHAARVAYAQRLFRGDDTASLLAAHVIASNPTIAQTVDASGGAAVPDGDIEFALASIWTARALAFAD